MNYLAYDGPSGFFNSTRLAFSQQIWVGVTSSGHFKKGYGLHGILYGGPGNLSDGGAGLKYQWGPAVSKGDVVGLLLDLSDKSKLNVCGKFFEVV